jgi:hypothetical protein
MDAYRSVFLVTSNRSLPADAGGRGLTGDVAWPTIGSYGTKNDDDRDERFVGGIDGIWTLASSCLIRLRIAPMPIAFDRTTKFSGERSESIEHTATTTTTRSVLVVFAAR